MEIHLMQVRKNQAVIENQNQKNSLFLRVFYWFNYVLFNELVSDIYMNKCRSMWWTS